MLLRHNCILRDEAENTGAPGGAPAAPPPAPAAPPVAVPPPAAPVATPPAAAAPAAPAAPAPGLPPEPPPGAPDPNWLTRRLITATQRGDKQAEQRILTELGASSVEEARAAILARQQAADANKTLEQRHAEATERLTLSESMLREQAARMMMVLDENQRAAVNAHVADLKKLGAKGEEHHLQLASIQHFGSTWAQQEADRRAAAPPPAAPVAAPPAPVATSAPAPAAPASVAPGSPPDPLALYNNARSKNPFAAAAYGQQNAHQVYKDKT